MGFPLSHSSSLPWMWLYLSGRLRAASFFALTGLTPPRMVARPTTQHTTRILRVRSSPHAKGAMDWIHIQERWGEYKFAAKRRWDKLSEQQLHGTRGQRQYLVKRVQEAYSLTHAEAEREISAWQAQLMGDQK